MLGSTQLIAVSNLSQVAMVHQVDLGNPFHVAGAVIVGMTFWAVSAISSDAYWAVGSISEKWLGISYAYALLAISVILGATRFSTSWFIVKLTTERYWFHNRGLLCVREACSVPDTCRIQYGRLLSSGPFCWQLAPGRDQYRSTTV